MPRGYPDPDCPLSLAHLAELAVPPAELIDVAAAGGFASVGLRIARAAPGGPEYPLASEAERAEVRRRMSATGVGLLYVELISISAATRVADCRAILETGAALGATRLTVAGDSADLDLVADRMAGICELARGYSIAVDLEFMPFRAVRTLSEAATVVRKTGQPNAHILLDTLHLYRSGSSLDELRGLDPKLLGTIQLCDAPRIAPPADQLATEARTNRLLPGAGDLDLWRVIDALPIPLEVGVEVPLFGRHPELAPAERARMMVRATRDFLKQRSAT